ncbi:hypothetical protein OsI_38467 [Oryza sativa Indica Group]|uniref:Uncharacterized protein n=1 Tax=Oryza sativa subsp. indica TaxID=39946 RepID=B8BM31_ORYSI|nr:hypothetical protein OsI_38467 [Oryza sativa Indica Group]
MGASAACTALIPSASADGVNERRDVAPVLDLGCGPKLGRNNAEISTKQNCTVAQDRHALCDQTRFKHFHNVEFEDCMVNRAFSVIVMVDAKFHSEAHGPLQCVFNRLYREVTLVDTRCQLVVIGVYANHLTTHVLQWASTFANNHVVVGTMLQLDRTYYFRWFVVNGEVNLSFVDRYHVTRWVHIAEVLDSKSSFNKNIKHA